ncbi:MAG: hypothetical protein EBX39_12185 [Actinobacteria bacterium]|nr:hypothetical protein [Actinomycetota bacterium]
MSKNQGWLLTYYNYLLNNPVAFVPYSKEALVVLRDGCGSGRQLSPAGMLAAMDLAGPLSSVGWDTVQPGSFDFPRDHGPHWNIRNEWYYLACNCVTDKQEAVTILLAIIRRGTIPFAIAKQNTIDPVDQTQLQIVACEASVELPGNVYLTSTDAFDGTDTSRTLITMKADPLFQWSVFSSTGRQYGLAYTQSVDSSGTTARYSIQCGVSTDRFQIQLSLTAGDGSSNPPQFFLQGENGCAPCIDGVGYRYYSWPNLKVTGTVVVPPSTSGAGGTTYTLTGQGWLDHQWGSRMQPFGYIDNLYLRAVTLLTGQYPKTLMPQWDWFFMHLDNNMHITTAVLPSFGINGASVTPLTNTSIVQFSGASQDNMTVTTFQGDGTVEKSGWTQVYCNWYASQWKLNWNHGGLVIELTLTGQQPLPTGRMKGTGTVVVRHDLPAPALPQASGSSRDRSSCTLGCPLRGRSAVRTAGRGRR